MVRPKTDIWSHQSDMKTQKEAKNIYGQSNQQTTPLLKTLRRGAPFTYIE